MTRQSISNWENDKNYPDLNSLLLMSEVFNISLDELVKGDIEYMKEKLDKSNDDQFVNDSGLYAAILTVMIFSPYPLFKYLKWIGLGIYILISILGMYYASRVEKFKKDNDLQTFKDIDAFLKGKKLDQIDRNKSKKIGFLQSIMLAVFVAIFTFGVFYLFHRLIG